VMVTFCQAAAPFIPFITENIYRNLRTEDMPESVHLCDYPDLPESVIDTALNERMARTMKAVSLGRFLRSQTSLKVRQPLAAAVLVSASAAVRADLSAMAPVIAEELNVKEVRIEEDEEKLVTLSAKPNLKKLGPKYGKQMKEIAGLVAALTSPQFGQLRKGAALQVTLADGSAVSLTEEDVLVQRAEMEGMTVANEGDITVALDTRLNEALILEGWAREVVSKLQNLRKELGFEVTDRIKIEYQAPAEIAKAIESQAAYICSETLAVEMRPGDGGEWQEVEMNGLTAGFRLTKA